MIYMEKSREMLEKSKCNFSRRKYFFLKFNSKFIYMICIEKSKEMLEKAREMLRKSGEMVEKSSGDL